MSVIPLPPPVSARKRIPMRVIRALVDHIIVVRSSETIERRKQLGDWFLIEVTGKGKILYERPDR
mgnify:CR=1 FL=1